MATSWPISEISSCLETVAPGAKWISREADYCWSVWNQPPYGQWLISSFHSASSCWGLTLISKDMNSRLMHGRKALTRAYPVSKEPENGYVTFRGRRILVAEFEMMSVSYRRRALISTVYLINARNRNILPRFLVNPAPTLQVKKLGTILQEYFGLVRTGNSGAWEVFQRRESRSMKIGASSAPLREESPCGVGLRAPFRAHLRDVRPRQFFPFVSPL